MRLSWYLYILVAAVLLLLECIPNPVGFNGLDWLSLLCHLVTAVASLVLLALILPVADVNVSESGATGCAVW